MMASVGDRRQRSANPRTPVSYVLTVENKGHYLHFRVTGANTPANVAGYLHEATAKCVELGCPNALVEENLEGPELGLGSVAEIVGAASVEAREAVGLVAFVNTNPAHDRGLARFTENVATNRAVNFRVFRTVADAERWISFYSRQA
jgi:hypothetical protein